MSKKATKKPLESDETKSNIVRCMMCKAEISTLEKGISKVLNYKPFGITSKNGCVMTALDLAKNNGRICLACTLKSKIKTKR